MTTRVYPIHRAAGRPVVFKGFKGPYIILAGLSLVTDLLLFIILYVSGVSSWVCVLLVFGLGWMALAKIATLSRRYGPDGLQKRLGAKRLTIRFGSRRELFHPLNNKNYVQEQQGITAEDRILRAYPHQ